MCIQENMPIPRREEEDDYIDFGLNVNENVNENENPERNRINPDLVAGRRLQRRLIQNMYA